MREYFSQMVSGLTFTEGSLLDVGVTVVGGGGGGGGSGGGGGGCILWFSLNIFFRCGCCCCHGHGLGGYFVAAVAAGLSA